MMSTQKSGSEWVHDGLRALAAGAFEPVAYLELEVLRVRLCAEARLVERDPDLEEDPEAPMARVEVEALVSTVRDRAFAASSDEGLPPLLQLMRRFTLSPLEMDVLLAALAPHLEPDLTEIFRLLRGGMLSEHVDPTLLLRLFGDSFAAKVDLRRAIGPQSPLLRNRLLEVARLPAGTTALGCAITVHPRIVHFALGEEGLPRLVAPYCAVEQPEVGLDAVVLPEGLRGRILDLLRPQKNLAPRLRAWGYDRVLAYGRGAVLLLVGAPGTGKTLLAGALAHAIEVPMLRVHMAKMLGAAVGLEDVLGELAVETRLRRALLFFDDCGPLFAERGPALSAMLAFLEQHEGIMVLATNQTENLDLALERRVLLRVDLPRPDRRAREFIFETLLPPDVPIAEGVDLGALAAAYDFTGGSIKNVVLTALSHAVERSPETPVIDQAVLREACDAQLRYRLDDYAVRSEPKLSLDALVLPEKVAEQVQDLLAAARDHEMVMTAWGFGERLVTGRGLVALFDGPPGTGKTLCAEILGGELGLPLSRINIPQVVSRWVGETEQRLQDIFRRARASRTILLFDEADALFGRRVENTQSANDRYANMEVNLLLQEIERYDGIVLLTTNLYGALDPAMQRRIQFRITFPEPDAPLRARIWRRLIPGAAPLDEDVRFDQLGARFDLSGGRIQNAVLRAAYRARREASARITQRHLVQAAMEESKAAGKVVRDPGKTPPPQPRPSPVPTGRR